MGTFTEMGRDYWLRKTQEVLATIQVCPQIQINVPLLCHAICVERGGVPLRAPARNRDVQHTY